MFLGSKRLPVWGGILIGNVVFIYWVLGWDDCYCIWILVMAILSRYLCSMCASIVDNVCHDFTSNLECWGIFLGSL